MRKHLMIAVEWYGPFKGIDAARAVAKGRVGGFRWDQGLYLAISSDTRRNQRRRIDYIGRSGEVHKRISHRHKKLTAIRGTPEIWLGEITSAEPGGKKNYVSRDTLRFAEMMLVYYLKPHLNEQMFERGPKRDVTLLNTWWKIDLKLDDPYEDIQPYQRRPIRDWPDLFYYPGEGFDATAVWFKGSRAPVTFVMGDVDSVKPKRKKHARSGRS